MVVDIELVIALIGALAALVSALFVFYRWAVEQANARFEQLRHEIRIEIRAEIYRELLQLNVQWLSGNAEQRAYVERMAAKTGDQDAADE